MYNIIYNKLKNDKVNIIFSFYIFILISQNKILSVLVTKTYIYNESCIINNTINITKRYFHYNIYN